VRAYLNGNDDGIDAGQSQVVGPGLVDGLLRVHLGHPESGAHLLAESVTFASKWGRQSTKIRESGQARAPAYLVEGNDAERQVLLAEGSQLDGELIERRDDGRRGVDDLGWGRKEEASVETT
jgi:hypothetical protein